MNNNKGEEEISIDHSTNEKVKENSKKPLEDNTNKVMRGCM